MSDERCPGGWCSMTLCSTCGEVPTMIDKGAGHPNLYRCPNGCDTCEPIAAWREDCPHHPALAEAEARTAAVEAERDELHRLVWRTKDALIAALTGEADEHVDHLTWSKTQAALTGEADDGE